MRIRILVFSLALVLALSASAVRIDSDADGGTQFYFGLDVPTATSAGTQVCVMCSVHVSGKVAGDVVTVGGDITVDGAVTDDVVSVGGNVILNGVGQIGGDAVSVGGVLRGDTRAIKGAKEDHPLPGTSWMPGLLRSYLVLFVLLILSGWIIAALFMAVLRHRIDRLCESLGQRRLWVILAGIFAVAAVVGLEVASDYVHGDLDDLLLLASLLLLVIIGGAGYTAMARSLGSRVGLHGRWTSVLAGTVLLAAVQTIPLVGQVLAVPLAVIASGTAVVNRFGFGNKAIAVAAAHKGM